jgi:hypothetical protein
VTSDAFAIRNTPSGGYEALRIRELLQLVEAVDFPAGEPFAEYRQLDRSLARMTAYTMGLIGEASKDFESLADAVSAIRTEQWKGATREVLWTMPRDRRKLSSPWVLVTRGKQSECDSRDQVLRALLADTERDDPRRAVAQEQRLRPLSRVDSRVARKDDLVIQCELLGRVRVMKLNQLVFAKSCRASDDIGWSLALENRTMYAVGTVAENSFAEIEDAVRAIEADRLIFSSKSVMWRVPDMRSNGFLIYEAHRLGSP